MRKRTVVLVSSRDVYPSTVVPCLSIISRNDALDGEITGALGRLEHAHRFRTSVVEVGTSGHAISAIRIASGNIYDSAPSDTTIVRLTHQNVLVASVVLGCVVDLKRTIAGDAAEGFLRAKHQYSQFSHAQTELTQRPLTPLAPR